MTGISSIIERISQSERATDEGLGAVAVSKAFDLASSLVTRARPLVALYNPLSGEVTSFRVRRGFRSNDLLMAVGTGSDQTVSSSRSAARLLIRLAGRVAEMRARGYIEI